MKIILIFSVLFLFTFITINAQFKVLGEGPLFEEPEEGWANITQLKNGNTLFLHLRTKRHFKITYDFYNTLHKKIYSGEFTPEDDNLALEIENIFEIGGNVAVFLKTNINNIPVLQKLIINGKDGTQKDFSTVIGITPRPAESYDQLNTINQRISPQIIKSQANNQYVIVSTEKDSINGKKKLKMSLCDDNHKMIKSFFLIDSTGDRNYLSFGDIVFIDDQKIGVVASGASMKPGNGQKDVFIVDLKTDYQQIIQLPAEYEWSVVDEKIKINPLANQILILTSSGDLKKEVFLNSHLKAVDIASQKVIYMKKILPPPAMEKNLELFKQNKHEAMPIQNFFINNDGNVVIVYEGTEVSTWRFTSGRTSISTILGNLVVAKYDKNGDETGSIIIPKSQKSIEVEYSALHDGGAFYCTTHLLKGSQYKSFTYFSSQNKDYIFLNDSPENIEKMKKGKLETTTSSKDGEAYYIDLTQKDLISERNQMFPNKEGKKQITPVLFSVADYDRQNNILVTIKLETKGKDNGIRLVWLQP